MKKLIQIQSIINRIEDFTLETKFHSTFNYLNEKTLVIKTYYWQQAAYYKGIFDKSKNSCLIEIKDSKLTITTLEDD